MKQTKSAVAYLESRKLWKGFGGKTVLDMGFNGGRFHYRGKLTEAEKQIWIDLGMMKAIGESSYRSWAKDCIIFPLKNKKAQIVSFYGRSTTNNKDQRHYYHKDRQGLYPHYPSSLTNRLILTESIIDAASLIISNVLTEELGVLACYGTKGLTAEHIEAIKKLRDLKEVIFFFDGDQAGIKQIDKYSKQLSGIKKNMIISKINTPDGEDVNSLHVGHELEVFQHLLENRTVLFMSDNQPSELFSFNGSDNGQAKSNGQIKPLKSQLNTSNPEHIIYETKGIKVHIWGGIDQHNLGRLKVSLHIQSKQSLSNNCRSSNQSGQ